MKNLFRKKTKKEFHLLVRAVIHDDNNDSLLVAKMKGANYCFLPGGHYEAGETLTDALAREIKEEMGLFAEVKQYLGVIENGWQKDNGYHYEINHIFEVLIKNVNAKTDIFSQENHIEFLWIKTDDLEKQNLLPAIIRPLILNLLKGEKKIWQESNFQRPMLNIGR